MSPSPPSCSLRVPHGIIVLGTKLRDFEKILFLKEIINKCTTGAFGDFILVILFLKKILNKCTTGAFVKYLFEK